MNNYRLIRDAIFSNNDSCTMRVWAMYDAIFQKIRVFCIPSNSTAAFVAKMISYC